MSEWVTLNGPSHLICVRVRAKGDCNGIDLHILIINSRFGSKLLAARLSGAVVGLSARQRCVVATVKAC